jgi:hypothetical protein
MQPTLYDTSDTHRPCVSYTEGCLYYIICRCGKCDAISANDCTQDCAGVWGGIKKKDVCGTCGGEGKSCRTPPPPPAPICTTSPRAMLAAVGRFTN